MLSLTNNIRIVRIDKYNYSFEHYKEIEVKKEKNMENTKALQIFVKEQKT